MARLRVLLVAGTIALVLAGGLAAAASLGGADSAPRHAAEAMASPAVPVARLLTGPRSGPDVPNLVGVLVALALVVAGAAWVAFLGPAGTRRLLPARTAALRSRGPPRARHHH